MSVSARKCKTNDWFCFWFLCCWKSNDFYLSEEFGLKINSIQLFQRKNRRGQHIWAGRNFGEKGVGKIWSKSEELLVWGCVSPLIIAVAVEKIKLMKMTRRRIKCFVHILHRSPVYVTIQFWFNSMLWIFLVIV